MTRISTHPDVNFTVVINPGNGPGPDSLPDANYTREIPKLASYSNVRLLGYVHTSYAQRNISLLRKDIETYAAWPSESSNPNLTVQGIFFDETPQQFSDQAVTYLQNLTDLVKSQKAFGPDGFVSCPPPLSPPVPPNHESRFQGPWLCHTSLLAYSRHTESHPCSRDFHATFKCSAISSAQSTVAPLFDTVNISFAFFWLLFLAAMAPRLRFPTSEPLGHGLTASWSYFMRAE